MQSVIKKLVRASAGTGKTYRLSLEYIGLLLRYREWGLKFSEILVLTFTRKATAEIRDRIFNHLALLASGDETEDARILIDNLRKVLPGELSTADRQYLKQCYHDMLMNKEQVAISTIDTFTNKIFKSMIAPFLGLTGYEIADANDPALFEELYAFALNEENFPETKDLLERTNKRNLKDYEKLISSLLDKRWMFHFIDTLSINESNTHRTTGLAENHLHEFRCHFAAAADAFQVYLNGHEKRDKPEELIRTDIWKLFFKMEKPAYDQIADGMKHQLADESFIRLNHKTIKKYFKFWNGTRCFRKNTDKGRDESILNELELARTHLNEYLYHALFVPEQETLRRIAGMLADKYDEIVLRDQVFKHADITYFVYRELYNPELSLLADDAVANVFYELLASRIRFLLIDEFQDTSLVQFRMLRPIISEVTSGEGQKPYGGVIVVGDEKQAIYGWRGGERDLLAAMPALIHGAEQSSLDVCFRSSRIIIDFVNGFFTSPDLHEALNRSGIDWPYVPVACDRQETAGCVRVRFYKVNDKAMADDEGNDEEKTGSNRYLDFVRQEVRPLLRDGRIMARRAAILAREKRTLDGIAAALADEGYDCIQEASYCVMHHRAIKPLIYLLHYLTAWDFNDLLRFLRSDYIRLPGVDLKKLILAHRRIVGEEGNRSVWRLMAELFPGIPAICHTAAVIEKCLRLDVLLQCRTILDEFAVAQIFDLENDWKNVDHFLQITADFQQNPRDYVNGTAGFLQYLADHEQEDALKLVGLSEVDAIRLMTIHKSKGMEFDHVFVFWDAAAGKGGSHNEMQSFLNYSSDFQHLAEYALTFTHAKLLEDSSRRPLFEAEARRQEMEELNTFYVALTRARDHLMVFIAYKEKPDRDSEGEETKLDVKKLMNEKMRGYLEKSGWLREQKSGGAEADLGQLAAPAEPVKVTPLKERTPIEEYLQMDRGSFWIPRETFPEEPYLNYKSMYLKKRSLDRGNVVHHYLSMIKYDGEEARRLAAGQTRAFFGTLLPVKEIDALIERADSFIDSEKELFSPQQWEKVFTEFSIFDLDGGKKRLDRLVVNDRRKRVLIIDFKTGEVTQPEQMQEYVRLVQSLPYVAQQGYRVTGEYREIKI